MVIFCLMCHQIGSTLVIKLKIILSFGWGIAIEITIIVGMFPKDQVFLSQSQWVCFHAA